MWNVKNVKKCEKYKKCETCGIKCKYCDYFLEYANFKDDLTEYKKFDEKLKERFFNIYKFSNHDNNKFILLLQKRCLSLRMYGYWEKFNETTLHEK